MVSLFFRKLGHRKPVTQAYYESEKLFFCEALGPAQQEHVPTPPLRRGVITFLPKVEWNELCQDFPETTLSIGRIL